MVYMGMATSQAKDLNEEMESTVLTAKKAWSNLRRLWGNSKGARDEALQALKDKMRPDLDECDVFPFSPEERHRRVTALLREIGSPELDRKQDAQKAVWPGDPTSPLPAPGQLALEDGDAGSLDAVRKSSECSSDVDSNAETLELPGKAAREACVFARLNFLRSHHDLDVPKCACSGSFFFSSACSLSICELSLLRFPFSHTPLYLSFLPLSRPPALSLVVPLLSARLLQCPSESICHPSISLCLFVSVSLSLSLSLSIVVYLCSLLFPSLPFPSSLLFPFPSFPFPYFSLHSLPFPLFLSLSVSLSSLCISLSLSPSLPSYLFLFCFLSLSLSSWTFLLPVPLTCAAQASAGEGEEEELSDSDALWEKDAWLKKQKSTDSYMV